MKNALKILFTFSIFRIPNPAIWIVLLSGLPLIITEGNSSDGFSTYSGIFILAGLLMAIASCIYNIIQEQK